MRAGPRRRAPALLAVLASLLFLMATSSLNVARAAPPHVPRPRRDLDAGVCAALIGRLDVASGAVLCRASKTFRDVALGSGSSVAALHCPDASTAATISRHDTCSRLLDHIDTLVKVDAHMERTGRTQSREAARTRRSPRDSRRSTSPATSPQRCRNLLADARACLERRHGARNPLTVDLILTAMDALVTTIASFELQLLDVEARFEVEQMVAAAYHEELGPILVDMDANGWDEDEGPQVEVMVAAYDRMFEALLPFTGRGLFYRWERVRNALIKQLRHCSCDENSTDEQDPSCAGFERLLRLQESPHRMHRLLERALRATFGKLSMETRVRRLSMIAPELESWANECEDVYRNVCATYVRWDKNTRSANGVGDYGSDVDFVEDDAMGDADDGWSCPSHLFLSTGQLVDRIRTSNARVLGARTSTAEPTPEQPISPRSLRRALLATPQLLADRLTPSAAVVGALMCRTYTGPARVSGVALVDVVMRWFMLALMAPVASGVRAAVERKARACLPWPPVIDEPLQEEADADGP